MASSEYAECLAYLKQGAALDVAVFRSWFDVRRGGCIGYICMCGCEWLKEKDENGGTLLIHALLYEAPEAVAMALFKAWPDAAKEMDNYGNTPLVHALGKKAPEAVVMALFEAWPDAVKEKNFFGNTPLVHALENEAPEAVVMALVGAWPGAAKEKTKGGDTVLHIALKNNAPDAVVMALFEAWPDAVKEKTKFVGETPLHLAAQFKAPKAVVMALFEAWPDAVKEKNFLGKIPLHIALGYGAPDAVVMALFEAWPDAVKEEDNQGDAALHHALENNAPEAVALALLEAWPDAVKAKNGDGNTPLVCALQNKAPDAVVMALIAARPDAAKVKTNAGYVDRDGYTPLHFAAEFHASDAVVRALVAAFPGAVKEATEISTWWSSNEPQGGGDTVLHTLAAAPWAAGCSSVAEARNANIICFTLVEKRASLTATNALGQTPAQASQAAKELDGTGDRERWMIASPSGTLFNQFGVAARRAHRQRKYHLVASFREIAAYKRRTHLSLEHFRDWTTVSHAWCTPSAKLVALTVLMVGDTYKRGLLPRMPMDCWHRILNCIPRHELRQGGCEPEAEQVAQAKYSAILREARARVDAENVVLLLSVKFNNWSD